MDSEEQQDISQQDISWLLAYGHKIVLNCKHEFHPNCITEWLDMLFNKYLRPRCPICRADVIIFRKYVADTSLMYDIFIVKNI